MIPIINIHDNNKINISNIVNKIDLIFRKKIRIPLNLNNLFYFAITDHVVFPF